MKPFYFHILFIHSQGFSISLSLSLLISFLVTLGEDDYLSLFLSDWLVFGFVSVIHHAEIRRYFIFSEKEMKKEDTPY